MAVPFLGEIKMFAANFAPRGWAFCAGQLLPIMQNQALFALLGTTYGGNGATTFALPDLRGRAPVHWGNGPGLPNVTQGELSGQASVTLIQQQLPPHSHGVRASGDIAGATNPSNAALGAKGRGGVDAYAIGGTLTPLAAGTGGIAGSGQAHNNMQPSLAVNFIIALEGVFPSRN